MLICSAQMPSKICCRAKRCKHRAFTMIELMVVILIVSMFVILATSNTLGIFGRGKFERQVYGLTATLEKAALAAAESDRKYEVIIDIDEQSYTLRQITMPDLSVVLEEEVIAQEDLSASCVTIYVEFDDETWTNNGQAKFRVGRAGWQYGGKIVLQDENQNEYSIVVNRLNKNMELKKGDAAILKPKKNDEMVF